MKIHKGYTFRIYPTKEQEILINKTLGCCRYVWNWALGTQKKKDAYWYITEEMVQNGQLPENQWKSDFFQASNEQKELTKLKKELSWLKEADATALQNSLQDLGKSFEQYYQKKKGKPKFKSKKNEVHSYTSKCNYSKSSATIRVEQEGLIRIPKLGLVSFHSRENSQYSYGFFAQDHFFACSRKPSDMHRRSSCEEYVEKREVG